MVVEQVTSSQVQQGEPPEIDAREHFWVLTPDNSLPWSIFDMTDRDLNPAVEEPGVVAQRYAPGGTDGALMRWDFDAIYHTNFGGLVKYDLTKLSEVPASFQVSALPAYESYSPAIVAATLPGPAGGLVYTSHATEQMDIVEVGAADTRIVSVNGRGRAVEWSLDPVTHEPTSAYVDPSKVRLIPPVSLAGVGSLTPASPLDDQVNALWALGGPATGIANHYQGYSNSIARGQGIFSGRPYVVIDLALRGDESCTSTKPDAFPTADRILVGRYWYPWTDENSVEHPEAWQVLDLTATLDCERILEPLSLDLAISPDQSHLVVTANNGAFVVGLYGGDTEQQDPLLAEQDWWAASRFVTHTCGVPPCSGSNLPVIPFLDGISYREVRGVTWIGTGLLAFNLTEPYLGAIGGKGGALAIFRFAHHAHAVGTLAALLEDRDAIGALPVVDQIQGTFLNGGGALGAHGLDVGTYRLYATSNGSGAVMEFEVLDTTPLTVTQIGVFDAGTHFTETPDCIPYDVGHPEGLPIVLVPRFLQTVALLASTGFKDPIGGQ